MNTSKDIKQKKKIKTPKSAVVKQDNSLSSSLANNNDNFPKSEINEVTSSKRRRPRKKKSLKISQITSDDPDSASNIVTSKAVEVKISISTNTIDEDSSLNIRTINFDTNKKSSNTHIESENIITTEQVKTDAVPDLLTESNYSVSEKSISSVPVNNSTTAAMPPPNTEKTREQIQAERKMKKSMKQSGKKQEPVGGEKKSDVNKTQPIQQMNVEATKTPELTKAPAKLITNVEATKTMHIIQTSSVELNSNEAEKSRDAIKAEREAKKLAKQARKTKLPNDEPLGNEIPLEKTIVESKSLISSEKVTKSPMNQENDSALSNKLSVGKTANVAEKSKAELKAERRAKQEAQRAAKEASKTGVNENFKEPANNVKAKPIIAGAEIKKLTVTEKPKPKVNQNFHKVKLFNHLYAEKERPAIPVNFPEIHKAIIRLGVQYASHTIIGSNARCIALLNALKEVVRDYSLPPNVEFSRGFEAHLAPCLKFLNSCRPHAVSMNNALKHIKWQLTQLPNNSLENDGKSKLCEAIDVYIKDQIEVAGKAISIAVTKKIANDDIILTYGCSSLIENILVDAAVEKNFRVVVVEAHPWKEGKEMLRRLTARGIKCSLVMISALSFVMREINKVVLGAGALLANGYVMARAGTAQVAMVAHAHNVPVLVCCETHKFSERVQTDSFVYNEIGDPDELINCNYSNVNNPLVNWRSYNMLSPLNLFYDVTPPDLVTAVVTELAVLPCTSVPVILRMKPSEFM